MCNPKTMFKFGLVLLALAGVLFAAVPEFRTWIINSGPLLLILLCPLHMLYCMLTMKKKEFQQPQAEPVALPAPNKQDA